MPHSSLRMQVALGCRSATARRRAAALHGKLHLVLVHLAATAALFVGSPAPAQRMNTYIGGILGEKVLNPDAVALEVQNFALRRLPPLAVPGSADAWTSESRRLRERYLREIVFHGWPQEWV